jgi:DnaK suppressor protein
VAPLPAGELARFRALLIDRITEMFRAVHRDVRDATGRESYAQNTDPRDEGDDALELQLHDLQTTLDERDAALAQTMELALQRIRSGEYGTCVDCGNPIELDRLRAVPWAIRCFDDQEAFEQRNQYHPPTM